MRAALRYGALTTKRLTPKQLEARAEAFAEVAGHLRLDWTEDADEREQGNSLAEMLEAEAVVWTQRARRFSSWPADSFKLGVSKK